MVTHSTCGIALVVTKERKQECLFWWKGQLQRPGVISLQAFCFLVSACDQN